MINKLNLQSQYVFFACSEEEMVSQNKETNDWEIEGWNIVWQDEFDKDSLDLTKWSHEIGGADGVIMNYNFILIQTPTHMLKMGILF